MKKMKKHWIKTAKLKKEKRKNEEWGIHMLLPYVSLEFPMEKTKKEYPHSFKFIKEDDCEDGDCIVW